MTQDEFARLLARFAEKPVTSTVGRHVYLWHGAEDRLRAIIPGGVLDSLDLHSLAATATRAPAEQPEASRIIQRLIETWLGGNLGQQRQHIILITGCDLLARYRVPLTPLFQWASDTVMFVLVVENLQSRALARRMPDYVSFQPQAALAYLKEIVSENAIIGAGV